MNGWEAAGVVIGAFGLGCFSAFVVFVKILEWFCKEISHIDG